jgi:pimeloyl-ACP methyl ester carboxylesterase
MTEPKTYTLDVPGAVLTYDVREPETQSSEPPLFLYGAPMGAAGFITLASHFPDRTVITYDQRGAERSKRTDDRDVTVHVQADDLHRIAEAVGGGPVDAFGTSGGANVGIAWVEQYPDDLRTMVAHEPPLYPVLPDAPVIEAINRDIHETYLREGHGPGMAKFIAYVMHEGPVTEDYLAQPAPDPAMFGLSTEDDGSRDDALLGVNMKHINAYNPDVEKLKAAPTRIVLAAGAESGEIQVVRTTRALAELLGIDVTEFPGDHGGFLGGEYGQRGKPDEFAAKLREVLAG